MILDDTVDIYQRSSVAGGIGSGTDYEWTSAREEDVPANVTKRGNLPEVREQIAGQAEIQYEWLCFLPRYNSGEERTVEDHDKIKWDEMLHPINGIYKNSLHIILALQQPEEA